MAESNLREEVLETHRKERKDLQAKIQNLKSSATKGDKKKKKEVSAEIALLEAQLNTKHENELREFDFVSQLQGAGESFSEAFDSNSAVDANNAPPRISKAQKRRDKKASKAKEREENISQQDIINLSGARHIESEKLKNILSERGLSVCEVPSDGDCLYKAVEHQLSTLKVKNTSVKQLRQETSAYMLKHGEDFIQFLVHSGTGNVMSKEQYEEYCTDIICKPTWGGHVEIQALSHVCNTPIEVIQADGPSIIVGENYSTAKLILSYHRHMYGLGEHYNSVVQKVDINEDF